MTDETPEEFGRRHGQRAAEAVKTDLKKVAEITALRIALSELAVLLVEKKVLSKQDVVSHFLGVADQIMRTPTGAETGTEVFEQIANYVLDIPIKDD